MVFIIKKGKKLFSNKKRNRLPIIKDIFEKITKNKPYTVTQININMAFKSAWVGFIRIKELTYMAANAKKTTFAKSSFTKSNISFAERD